MRRSPLGPTTAAALVTLAVILAGFGSFELAGPLSQFPHTFSQTPLYWWTETSPLSVFCFLGLLVAAAGAQWVVDHFSPAPAWAAVLVLLGAGATITAFYFDSIGGTAVYSDRIETRAAALGAPLHQHRLADVSQVQVGCWYDRSHTRPMYVLVFSNGERIALDHGLTSEPRSPRWLATALAVDRMLRDQGTSRAVALNTMGEPNNSPGCVHQFADRFPPDYRAQVLKLMAPAGK